MDEMPLSLGHIRQMKTDTHTNRYPTDKYKSKGEFIRKIGGYKYYYQWLKNNPIKPIKVGRNDKCPCGSGLKYKKCCLNK